MNNPLVQPDPGLYIWTIATFLVLAVAAGEVCLAAAARGARAASGDDPQVARRCAAGEAGAGASERRVAEDSRGARAGGFDPLADAVRRRRLRDELKQKAQTEAAGVIKNAERQIEMETARGAADPQRSRGHLDRDRLEAARTQRDPEDNERLIEETFKQIEARRPS